MRTLLTLILCSLVLCSCGSAGNSDDHEVSQELIYDLAVSVSAVFAQTELAFNSMESDAFTPTTLIRPISSLPIVQPMISVQDSAQRYMVTQAPLHTANDTTYPVFDTQPCGESGQTRVTGTIRYHWIGDRVYADSDLKVAFENCADVATYYDEGDGQAVCEESFVLNGALFYTSEEDWRTYYDHNGVATMTTQNLRATRASGQTDDFGISVDISWVGKDNVTYSQCI